VDAIAHARDLRNERFQIGFAAASPVYQLTWILRGYDKFG